MPIGGAEAPGRPFVELRDHGGPPDRTGYRPVMPETQAPGRPSAMRQPSDVRGVRVLVAPVTEVAVISFTRPPA